jgi:hypothetical protein
VKKSRWMEVVLMDAIEVKEDFRCEWEFKLLKDLFN